MSQQAQMNMAAMGGPVGGGVPGAQMNAGTPSNSNMNPTPEFMLKKLNTAIYDYLLRNSKYDIAKSFQEQMPIETKTDTKESPNQRGGQQANGVDDSMDDGKDDAILKRPEGLPLPNNMLDGPFLQDWWCQFWEIWHGIRGRGKNGMQQTYVLNQRNAQKGRFGMMGAMDPNMQNLRGGYNVMQGMNSGMPMGPNDLRKSAIQQNNQQRNISPAQMQQMRQNAQQNPQMMQGNAMERQGSQMDGSGPRSGSPGSGDGPSSPKRQRVEGGMQQMNQGRPGQPGQMQGNQVGPRPDIPQTDPALLQQTLELLREKNIDPSKIPPQQLHNLSAQPANVQAQSVEVYSHSIQQQMQAALNNQSNKSNSNKGMNPNMGPGGAQGSPMNQAGMDGATGEFYANVNGRMPMPQNAAQVAAAAGQAGQAGNSNGNHALQDYQMQLMLLEQQNKKRLLMARQEQDNMGHPAGVGPNGQFAPGMSPQGSQRGADPSPNPNEMRGRGSPTPGMMDPNQVPPNMRAQMVMGPNGQIMRPPSSHPMASMTPQQQVEAMRAQGVQMPNGQFQGGQPPQGQMMQGQQGAQGGQPGQAQPLGTPRGQQNNMPPPPAPPANTGGTQPSSPSSQQPPPTPSQTNKAKPGTKKEPANKKGAANKKGGTTGAAPATESEQPPTPTPATPATPMNPNSFAHNKQLPNGQPAATAQANASANANTQQSQQQQQTAANAAPAAQPPGADMPFGSLGLDDGQFGNLGLDFGMDGDALDNFDFDSFLNNDDQSLGFDANFAFGDNEIGLDGTN